MPFCVWRGAVYMVTPAPKFSSEVILSSIGDVFVCKFAFFISQLIGEVLCFVG